MNVLHQFAEHFEDRFILQEIQDDGDQKYDDDDQQNVWSRW